MSGTSEIEERGGIQVIARTASILRLLGHNPEGLSLGVIAKTVKLPRSTVQRIVSALEDEQFVQVSRPGSGVRLGPALQKLVLHLESDFLSLARQDVDAIWQATGETVAFTKTTIQGTRYFFHIESPQEVRVVPKPPPRYPLHASAHGKLALARESDATVCELLDGTNLTRLTEQNISDLPRLLAQLGEVRRTGLAYDCEECGRGQCALATEVTYADSLYEIAVLVPAYRFEKNRLLIETALLGLRADIVWGEVPNRSNKH